MIYFFQSLKAMPRIGVRSNQQKDAMVKKEEKKRSEF